MSEFKKCANGHYYQDSYSACPYCPQPGSGTTDSPTAAIGQDKTQVYQPPTGAKPSSASSPDKTQVVAAPQTAQNQHMAAAINLPSNARKLVGWLVTYHDPIGKDFRLTEGRNTIGYGKENDIVVDFDSSVSSKHLTILYRLGDFLFKDELSTNGTFLNGVLANEGSLKDGDKIKTGNVVFMFRTAQF